MTQTYTGSYQVTWHDTENIKRSKAYPNYKDAQKAFKWLTDAGIEDADISVMVEDKIIK